MLNSLKLLPVYDSSDYNLVNDLIVPLLGQTKKYYRGVGFFTSGWLRTASKGIIELIENGGNAKIVMSPIMEKSDWEAFQLGEEARTNEYLKVILEKNIGSLANVLEKETLNALAWMIADGVLEFKFAVSKGVFGGDYHDKVGVFIDEQENLVAIHGSFNDTVKGSLNGEAFSVFKSWETGQYPYVKRHYERLTNLWGKGNNQFKVFTIPEAIQEKFVKLRSTDTRPYSLPGSLFPSSVVSPDTPCCKVKLHSFQEEAIKSWISADRRGIFEMATGTGKTVTALSAAVSRFENLEKLALVILVPYLHLLEQWQRNCESFGFSAILCSSKHGRWHLEVKSKVQDFNLNVINKLCILAVHQTASTDRFLDAIKRLNPQKTMLIGDEVHSLGSKKLVNALFSQAGMRLGLSATPKRWFDDEGTKCLLNYFGGICFEFPLEKAIEQKYLTPYDYYPQLVNLYPEEMAEYETITQMITSIANRAEEDFEVKEKLKKLLLKRARIISSAGQKLPRLLEILRVARKKAENLGEELRDILIYCAPGSHKDVLHAVSNLGLRCHEFVYDVSLSDRALILEQFAHGDIQVLVAIKCLDEGVDVPSTKTAFFLASTSNPKEFVQRRGRVLRLAKGKNKAEVYDFLVVPDPHLAPLKREIDAGLLKREMPRFVEFASAARNEFEARAVVRDLVDHYEMLNLLDEKPWDLYHRLTEAVGIDELYSGGDYV